MTKSEAISQLQERVDMINQYYAKDGLDDYKEALLMAIEALKNSSDLISRQAAIDAFDTHVDELIIGGEENARNVLNYLNNVIDTIKGLPSAQPEVLKCKDCYWWTKQSDSLQGRCDRYGFYPTGYWYCAAARGRREE